MSLTTVFFLLVSFALTGFDRHKPAHVISDNRFEGDARLWRNCIIVVPESMTRTY